MNTKADMINNSRDLYEGAVRELVSEGIIHENMRKLALRLCEDYRDKRPILLGVLNGCFIFMADLIREMNIPCEVDFIKISSYGDSMQSGHLKLLKDVDANLDGRHVIIIEDIVDTGKSLEFLKRHFGAKNPASLTLATMFVKEGHEEVAAAADYIGMTIPDQFVVGYGLDYSQQYRQLPYIGVIINPDVSQ
jgi:hypoxanthine phosphoribosyltransferase